MTVRRISSFAIAVAALMIVSFLAFGLDDRSPTVDRPKSATMALDAGGEPDSAWVAETSNATGIGKRALAAYGRATIRLGREDADCRLAWNTLAGIAETESNHGYFGGAQVDADGVARPAIIGIRLDGSPGVRAIPDTDEGALDADTIWDRAVGPFQFIPTTWQKWGADSDGDSTKDPHDMDDAALAAGRYLCDSGGDLAESRGWSDSVLAYNNSVAYARQVARTATKYAEAT